MTTIKPRRQRQREEKALTLLWLRRRQRRAERWLRSRQGSPAAPPPRHVAETLGWHYVTDRAGQVLHVPASVK